ncbi:hypothetical protein M8818_000470 [Zalaria obscura]|uniref:Uncharacterized protein n=1 Tax=Zalaria obscura TaxID=2024903 RepID=A0ACC3SND7_9PEZI
MGKTAKVKKRTESLHSRAARRAATPPDRSLTDVEKPAVDFAPKLHTVQDGSIKKNKQKPMSRQQRLRQQKGMERADQNLDKLVTKRAKSIVRAKRIDDRRGAWEELNEAARKKSRRETDTEPSLTKTQAFAMGDDVDLTEDTTEQSTIENVGSSIEAPAESTVDQTKPEDEIDEIL